VHPENKEPEVPLDTPPSKQGELSPHLTLWASISSAIASKVNEDTFNRWFQQLEPLKLSDDRLTLLAPNKIFQYWIESNYQNLLDQASEDIHGRKLQFEYLFAEDSATRSTSAPLIAQVSIPDEQTVQEMASHSGLNTRFTFNSFVVGVANQFAHAACTAVATKPGRTYNPLFIYGGVGLGKTHLMQAIGLKILESRKNAKVLYVTSERFANDFIDAIQASSLPKFRKKYRQADVLLIDDIQFLGGKERSQEEFFHTFNALFDGHKQIVLSSDRPPSEIANLEDRLVSRFEWGLTAEMQPPDVETRVAILGKKASDMKIRLPREIFQFLAERIRTNVRRLEGALMRVASFVSLNDGKLPDTPQLEQLLKDILQEEARRAITVEQIQKRVAEQFDVRIADMTSKRRPASIAFPRQVAMYLSRELTKHSLNEIGDAFGGRDHGTVLHAHRQVRDRMSKDERLRQLVASLDDQLRR
jgi:chromosomal replication initiator protein